MDKKKLNVRMVASYAGVSPATVSRVLNGNPTVDRELSQRVLAAVQELGYKGTALKNARNTIVFIVPAMRNNYYSNIVSGVIDMSAELGYRVVTMVSNFNPETELECLKAACAPDTAGILFTPITGRNPYELLPDLNGIPIVITGISHLDDSLVHVSQNYENTAYISTRYLLRLGRSRIVFVSHFWRDHIHSYEAFMNEYNSPAQSHYSVYSRYSGYCRALKEAGIAPDPELMCFSDYSYEKAYSCARQLLASPVSFDAVLAPNDLSGAGFLNLFREQGIQIPQQVSLVCMNSGLISELVSPAMTSIVSKDYELGVAAVRQLNNLIKGKPVSNILIDSELAIKNSTHAMQIQSS